MPPTPVLEAQEAIRRRFFRTIKFVLAGFLSAQIYGLIYLLYVPLISDIDAIQANASFNGTAANASNSRIVTSILALGIIFKNFEKINLQNHILISGFAIITHLLLAVLIDLYPFKEVFNNLKLLFHNSDTWQRRWSSFSHLVINWLLFLIYSKPETRRVRRMRTGQIEVGKQYTILTHVGTISLSSMTFKIQGGMIEILEKEDKDGCTEYDFNYQLDITVKGSGKKLSAVCALLVNTNENSGKIQKILINTDSDHSEIFDGYGTCGGTDTMDSDNYDYQFRGHAKTHVSPQKLCAGYHLFTLPFTVCGSSQP